jgi:hypothetical protein
MSDLLIRGCIERAGCICICVMLTTLEYIFLVPSWIVFLPANPFMLIATFYFIGGILLIINRKYLYLDRYYGSNYGYYVEEVTWQKPKK